MMPAWSWFPGIGVAKKRGLTVIHGVSFLRTLGTVIGCLAMVPRYRMTRPGHCPVVGIDDHLDTTTQTGR
jgi:hypothetical protein